MESMSAEAAYNEKETLLRAKAHLQNFFSTNGFWFLLYAALDVRFCIERTFFIYLIFIKNLELSKNLQKLYSAKDIKAEILKAEPHFYKKLAFMNAFMKFLPYGKSVAVPNLDLLSDAYGKLGNYLHAANRPDKTWKLREWWQSLIDTLGVSITHLESIHEGLFGGLELNEEGQQLFDKFVKGDISEAQLNDILKERFSKSPMKLVKDREKAR